MCSLLKRCALLYWTDITFGVLPKKVRKFAQHSNVNFSRTDQVMIHVTSMKDYVIRMTWSCRTYKSIHSCEWLSPLHINDSCHTHDGVINA